MLAAADAPPQTSAYLPAVLTFIVYFLGTSTPPAYIDIRLLHHSLSPSLLASSQLTRPGRVGHAAASPSPRTAFADLVRAQQRLDDCLSPELRDSAPNRQYHRYFSILLRSRITAFTVEQEGAGLGLRSTASVWWDVKKTISYSEEPCNTTLSSCRPRPSVQAMDTLLYSLPLRAPRQRTTARGRWLTSSEPPK